jgi:long-chain acyl-CoA synthetase
LIALFGATAARGVGVGLNGWWHTEEIAYGLRDSGCRYLIVDELLYDRVAPVIDSIEHLEKVFYIGDNPPEGTIPISALLQPRSDVPTVPINEDDPWVILYTSGTTGRSKGCITTHRGTVAQVQGVLHNFLIGLMTRGEPLPGLAADGTMVELTTLLTSPLFHVAGLHSTVCTSMTVGTRLVFGPARFDVDQVLSLMEREKVTTWMAIPTLLQRLLDHPKLGDFDLNSLQGISTGGAPAAPEMLQKASRILPRKPNTGATYGLTECHGMATSITSAESERKKGSVGKPMPLVQVKIIDAQGKTLGAREAGEICLFGCTITPGYWNRPDDTGETVRNGWLYTGDIGFLDEDGYLYISDRAKDMILRAGENVYCVEIENCISDHPEIEEAAVIGVPDREMGERVMAIVRKRPDSDIDALRVQAHVAEHLAKFKVPEIVTFTEAPLPRNAAGKLLKNELRSSHPPPPQYAETKRP